MIYSALFEGDMTRQLQKYNIFPCPDFWVFNFFLDFFKYLKSLKRIKLLYSYKLGGDECHNGQIN